MDFYEASVKPVRLKQKDIDNIDQINIRFPAKRIVLIERGDTVTENVLMAAALYPGETTIVGASSNYMVQDLCFFLEAWSASTRDWFDNAKSARQGSN